MISDWQRSVRVAFTRYAVALGDVVTRPLIVSRSIAACKHAGGWRSMSEVIRLKRPLLRHSPLWLLMTIIVGCVPAVVVVGALLVGVFIGTIAVQFPDGSSARQLSDGSGQAKVVFTDGGNGNARLDVYEGLIPGFTSAGATTARVDLNAGSVTGQVTTPSGEVKDLSGLIPGLQAAREGDKGFSISYDDGNAAYRYGMDLSGDTSDQGQSFAGDVTVTRKTTQGGQTLLDETGSGSIQTTKADDSARDVPLAPADPPVKAEAGPDLTVTPGASITLQASAAGGNGELRYAWEPKENLDNPTVLQPKASPKTTTTYTLTVADQKGQQATDTVRVAISNVPTDEDDAYGPVTSMPSPGLYRVTYTYAIDSLSATRPELLAFVSAEVSECEQYQGAKSHSHEYYVDIGTGGRVLAEYYKCGDLPDLNACSVADWVRILPLGYAESISVLPEGSPIPYDGMYFHQTALIFLDGGDESSRCGKNLWIGPEGFGSLYGDSYGESDGVCVTIEKQDSGSNSQGQNVWQRKWTRTVRLRSQGSLARVEFSDPCSGETRSTQIQNADDIELTFTVTDRLERADPLQGSVGNLW